MEERDRQAFESDFTFRDGSTRWFEVSVSPVPEGIFVLTVDVTDRKRAEEALRKSEERLRLAVRAANVGIFSLDIATDLFTVDDRARRIFALGEERELRWRDTRRRVHPEDLERHAQAVRRLVDPSTRGSVEALEYRLVLPGGETRWLSVAALACFPESTGPVRRAETIVGVAMDITRRKESEEKVLRMNRELEAFSCSVSHDLRAPLRAIEGFAGMIVPDADARARIDLRLESLPDAFGDAPLVRQVRLNLIASAVKYSSRRERPEIEVGRE